MDDLEKAVARAIVKADEQNGGPPWDYLMTMGKHVKGPIFDRARAAIAECFKWRPIESVPKLERHLVDLWVDGPVGRTKKSYGRRVTDCQYDKQYDSWIDPDGDWVTGRYFYDEGGERCFDPADKSDGAAVATHWMPRPIPPKEIEKEKQG